MANLRWRGAAAPADHTDMAEPDDETSAVFARLDEALAQVRGRLDGLAAGQEALAAMLTTLVERGNGNPAE